MPADAPNEGILTGRRSWVTPHLQVAFGDDVLFFLFARGFDSSVNHSRSVQNDGLASEFVRSVFRSYESATAPVALFIGSAIFFDSVLDPLIADTHPSIPASQPVSLPA